jgi:Tol biopolymer transport system component
MLRVTVGRSRHYHAYQCLERRRRGGLLLGRPYHRYVAFESAASNLIPGSLWEYSRIYVYDRQHRTLECVSRSSSGELADGVSEDPAISADGRYVAFTSSASNLVTGDENGTDDVFVRDRATGTTKRVSAALDGLSYGLPASRPSISADGRYTAYEANGTDGEHYVRLVYLYDAVTGTTARIPTALDGGVPDDSCTSPQVSQDGRFVFFVCAAGNVVAGPPSRMIRVLVYGIRTGRISPAVTTVDGGEPDGPCIAPVISADGRFVSFISGASNLVEGPAWGWQAYRFDRDTGETVLVSVRPEAGSTPLGADLCWMSPDGDYVAFTCWEFLPHFDGNSHLILRSPDGQLSEIDVAPDGTPGDGGVVGPRTTGLSAGARYIAFTSNAANLVGADTNGSADVFLWAAPPMAFADLAEGSWASNAVAACAAADIVCGYPDGTYRPAEEVTRAQMAVYLARALADGEVDVATGLDLPLFRDVPPSHWAYRYIQYIVLRGLARGYIGSYYLPDQAVDRAQMAAFVARAAAGSDSAVPPHSGPPTFADVYEWSWAYRYIEYAAAHGIARGYPDELYHPEIVVTRDQMAVYVARAFELEM